MPSIVDDILTVIFWSIAYLMIVYSGFRSIKIKKVSMPYIAGVANIAWEICALYWISGFWGYMLWLGIDIVIVCFGFLFLNSKVKKICYLVSILLCTLIFFLILHNSNKAFIYTVFIIDLLMAILYLIEYKKLSPVLKIPIAIAKLLGDFFAGFVFEQYTLTVVISSIVFVFNSIYLYLCIKEKITFTRTQSITTKA